jgi:hypothetical protein
MLRSILAWYVSSTDRFRSLAEGLRWGYVRLLSILVLFLLRTQVCLLFYMGVSYIHLQAAPLSSHPATIGDPRPHCLWHLKSEHTTRIVHLCCHGLNHLACGKRYNLLLLPVSVMGSLLQAWNINSIGLPTTIRECFMHKDRQLRLNGPVYHLVVPNMNICHGSVDCM